jgi:hypothetical protein
VTRAPGTNVFSSTPEARNPAAALDFVARAADHGRAIDDEQRMRIAKPPFDDFARDLDALRDVEASRHGVMSPRRAEDGGRKQPGRDGNPCELGQGHRLHSSSSHG